MRSRTFNRKKRKSNNRRKRKSLKGGANNSMNIGSENVMNKFNEKSIRLRYSEGLRNDIDEIDKNIDEQIMIIKHSNLEVLELRKEIDTIGERINELNDEIGYYKSLKDEFSVGKPRHDEIENPDYKDLVTKVLVITTKKNELKSVIEEIKLDIDKKLDMQNRFSVRIEELYLEKTKLIFLLKMDTLNNKGIKINFQRALLIGGVNQHNIDVLIRENNLNEELIYKPIREFARNFSSDIEEYNRKHSASPTRRGQAILTQFIAKHYFATG